MEGDDETFALVLGGNNPPGMWDVKNADVPPYRYSHVLVPGLTECSNHTTVCWMFRICSFTQNDLSAGASMLCDFVLQSFFRHSQMMQIIRGTSLHGVLFMKSAGVIKRKIIGDRKSVV